MSKEPFIVLLCLLTSTKALSKELQSTTGGNLSTNLRSTEDGAGTFSLAFVPGNYGTSVVDDGNPFSTDTAVSILLPAVRADDVGSRFADAALRRRRLLLSNKTGRSTDEDRRRRKGRRPSELISRSSTPKRKKGRKSMTTTVAPETTTRRLRLQNETDENKRMRLIQRALVLRHSVGLRPDIRRHAVASPASEPIDALAPLLHKQSNFWLYIARDVLNITAFCLRAPDYAMGLLSSCLIAIPAPTDVLFTIFKHHFYDSQLTLSKIQAQLSLYSFCAGCLESQVLLLNMFSINTVNVSSPFIPGNISGGPCALTRLTIALLPHELVPSRSKRTASMQTFTDSCNSNVHLLSSAEVLALAFSIIGVPALAARSYRDLTRLACSYVKSLNETSRALAELLTDTISLRRASLQLKAAIDFLLLRDNLGCSDVHGYCCFNVSDSSITVNSHIANLHLLANNITQHSAVFNNLLSWGSWLPDFSNIIHVVVASCLAFLAFLIFVCCCVQCLPKLVHIFTSSASKVVAVGYATQTLGVECPVHK